MTGIADLHLSRFTGSATHQGGIVGGNRALAENSIRSLNQLVSRQTDSDETVKHGMQVGHEHRCGHPVT